MNGEWAFRRLDGDGFVVFAPDFSEGVADLADGDVGFDALEDLWE